MPVTGAPPPGGSRSSTTAGLVVHASGAQLDDGAVQGPALAYVHLQVRTDGTSNG